ncbi:peptidase M23 [Rhodothermaceae bacterium RA]|nr:peptidase M23 [Rhodothermaceae bacterium RA]
MPARTRLLVAVASVVLAVSTGLLLTRTPTRPEETPPPPQPAEPAVTYDAFGFETGAYDVVEHRIRRNQTFSDILAEHNVPPGQVFRLARSAEDVFSVRRIQAGKTLRIYRDDSLQAARYLVYQPDPITYVVFSLDDSLNVRIGERPVHTVRRSVEGVITRSLYEALAEQGVNPLLAVRLSEVYAWQIDFFRIQPGDGFSIVYEEQVIDDEPVGIGSIVAARFSHFGQDFYAFRFEREEGTDYFDEQGNSLRKAFLKAPLEYYRLTSRYNPNRFHPVLKRRRAHLGTDYAAPTGTPIRATGDGVVIEAGYTRGNGNYVKIRHNGTYTTGYLHMSRFARGIQRGTRVRQGDVIGYVGSTGLATGPHVCYRFWKNGVQVDPLREKMPPSRPIEEQYRAAFEAERDHLLPLLGGAHTPQYALGTPATDDAVL